MRRYLLLVCLAGSLLSSGVASAQADSRIEVIEVAGIIDGSVERAVIGGIEQAERDNVTLVVLQIDSRGTVDVARTRRMAERVRGAHVPLATWIGPPGAGAEHGAALLARAGGVRGMAPGTSLGPATTLDLRGEVTVPRDSALPRALTPTQANVDVVAATVSELLEEIDGTEITVGGRSVTLETDPPGALIRFHKLDLLGRALHAAAQPSISYLLLLLGLVGVVFEVFHPSTGPAGVAGAASLSLSLYGVAVLGASWLGVALVVLGVAGFCVDLRYQGLGPFTLAGFGGLVAGSLVLYGGPWLRVSPWVTAFGIVAMVAFLLGAMTRVLRDLRAVARGELAVRDAHPHPNGNGGGHAS